MASDQPSYEDPPLSNKGDRLKAARVGAGFTQAELATLVDLSVNTISRIEANGDVETRDSTINLLANACFCRPEWLVNGTGGMRTPTQELSLKIRLLNKKPITSGQYLAPILSWEQAGSLSDIDKNAQYQFLSIDSIYSDSAFILESKGLGDNHLTLLDRELLVIDPNAEFKHGDLVLIKSGSGLPVLRKILQDGSEIYLKPLVAGIPVILKSSDDRILGVVCEIRSLRNI